MSNGGRRPLSLQARSLLAAGVVLAAFLGITGLALDRAIHETLLSSLQDRLRSYAEGYIAKSEVSRARRWIPPDVDPEAFRQPEQRPVCGRRRSGRSRWRAVRQLAQSFRARRGPAVHRKAEARREDLHDDADRRRWRPGIHVQYGLFVGAPEGPGPADDPHRRGRRPSRRAADCLPPQPAALLRRPRHRPAVAAARTRALDPDAGAPHHDRARPRRTRRAGAAVPGLSARAATPRQAASTTSSTASATASSATATRCPISPTA